MTIRGSFPATRPVTLLLLGTLVLALGGCAGGSFTPLTRSGDSYPLQAFFAPRSWPDSVATHLPEVDPRALEAAIHARTNEARHTHGLAPLAWSNRLSALTRMHSDAMARDAFFGHENERGEDATARARSYGLECRTHAGAALLEGVGENLFLAHRFNSYRVRHTADGGREYVFDWKTTDEIAREAVDSWLQSRTHRANLLSPHYVTQGIGVTMGDNATVFVTQQFIACRPSDALAAR